MVKGHREDRKRNRFSYISRPQVANGLAESTGASGLAWGEGDGSVARGGVGKWKGGVC